MFSTAAVSRTEAFDAMMDAFETQIEDEEIAELAQQARELAAEEDATAALRRAWQWGLSA